MARHCDDFTRSEALRHGIAQAGRGLRPIEAGMPTPAGTGLTRRSLMLRGAAAGLTVYGASKLMPEALEAGIAEAASGPAQPVLVSVFLPGGVDGLSVLAPTGDERFASLRPTLRIARGAGKAFTEDDRLEWTPAADALRVLHSEGKVSVIPAIGYDHPDQSHFTSRHFWEVGATDVQGRFGWLGRYLDQHGSADNPLQGLSLDSNLSPALAAGGVPVAAVDDPQDFGLWAPGVWGGVEDPLFSAIGALGTLPTEDGALRAARRVATQVDSIRRSLGPLQAVAGKPAFTAPVTYADNRFARRLSSLAAMLDAGLPLRAVTLDAPGNYDTHSGQASTLADDLRESCEALLAFQRDLEHRGLAGRVLTLVWSEFGRRPRQNADGTDHGAAGVGFVVGNRAGGRMLGEFPGLAKLDEHGNLRSTFDFRSLYCGLLEQWFGVDAGPIIPGAAGFARPALLS
ncbi:hypothetical protein DSM112329_04062 [Paraconexibacter sp. AEG42_29]|uniref:DUF1501 domain-containing protein n=1 Tax=Paraconexibacter sp. AEG42_29 TaxID=2997339 RepID=A0AAU7AZN0_9ACTN